MSCLFTSSFYDGFSSWPDHTLDFILTCETLKAENTKKKKSNNKSSFSQVKTLKEKIEQEKGKDNFSVSGLKLIYAGMSQAVVSLLKSSFFHLYFLGEPESMLP